MRVQEPQPRVQENHRRHQHVLLDGGRGGAAAARVAILQNQNLQKLHWGARQLPRVN